MRLRGRTGRDLQNIPLEKINKAVKEMSYPFDTEYNEKKRLVSIYLNPLTIRYFKNVADKHHTKYQRLMRTVLDQYAELH